LTIFRVYATRGIYIGAYGVVNLTERVGHITANGRCTGLTNASLRSVRGRGFWRCSYWNV
jgi:hypothetical protein